jgi:VIT1/CCC1 family predicted Fe2+/Mn2+ transporter
MPAALALAPAPAAPRVPAERHAASNLGWLRAAVLGANDGVLSTASLIVGVASAASDRPHILLAGVAGLVAGAMSMAAGEYVSVSSQADAETADLAKEAAELATDPRAETRELARIYQKRGLQRPLAIQVAQALMDHDALGAHARDELGISEITTAKPVQAAVASALSFATGAAAPLAAAMLVPTSMLLWAVVGVTLVTLALLGAAGARIGGAPVGQAALRVLFWGALAMAVTAAIGRLVGTPVA